MIEACDCNLDIPGVEHLPPHHHSGFYRDFARLNPDYVHPETGETSEEYMARKFPLGEEPSIWVPWKQVARELAVGC